MSGDPQSVALKPAAQAWADATSTPPFLYELTPRSPARPSTRCSPARYSSRAPLWMVDSV